MTIGEHDASSGQCPLCAQFQLADRLGALPGPRQGGWRAPCCWHQRSLDTLQTAVLIEKLRIFDDELAARRSVAHHYSAALAGSVKVPAVSPGVEPAWACYTVGTPERDKLAARLRCRGIATAVYYERPLHGHLAYSACPLVPGGTPVAGRLAAEVLSIPVHP